MKRNYFLDQYRGFTIISMVLFHTFYDINLYKNLAWYNKTSLNHIWQLSIAISFFIISGITANFLSPKKNIIRGIKISLLGFLISIITYIFDKNLLIIFGVLNGLGLSMILVGFIQKYIKVNKSFALIFLILFILTYRIPSGKLINYEFFANLYEKNLFFLGFPSSNFYSTDYFPIIPWFFIYMTGFLLKDLFVDNKFFEKFGKNNFLAKIGQHSIEIYLAHQIVIYLFVYLFFAI